MPKVDSIHIRIDGGMVSVPVHYSVTKHFYIQKANIPEKLSTHLRQLHFEGHKQLKFLKDLLQKKVDEYHEVTKQVTHVILYSVTFPMGISWSQSGPQSWSSKIEYQGFAGGEHGYGLNLQFREANMYSGEKTEYADLALEKGKKTAGCRYTDLNRFKVIEYDQDVWDFFQSVAESTKIMADKIMVFFKQDEQTLLEAMKNGQGLLPAPK